MSTAQAAPRFQPFSLLMKFWESFKKRVWYLHPKVHLPLSLSAAQAYNLLEMNGKPSIKRLEYRKLYAAGRRYLMQPREGGSFTMMTTEKVWWHPRARSRASAILHGNFETIDESNIRLNIRSNIRIHYLLDVLPIPSFFTSIIVFMWWPIWLLTFLVIALYLLSWIGHRLNASLEAHEMRFYIETILEDYMPNPPAQLPDKSNIVMSKDFEQVWDKFVEEMSEKT